MKENNQMRAEAMLSWRHLAEILLHLKLSLLNVRLLNGHIAFFLAEAIHPTTFTLMCFTETASNGEKLIVDSYENN